MFVRKNLKCQYLEYPIGVDTFTLTFSWHVHTDERDWFQTACRIQVLEDTAGVVFDTGVVESSRQSGLYWTIPALVSNRRYQWRVRVRNTQGKFSDWSRPAVFVTGLMRPEEWNGFPGKGSMALGPFPYSGAGQTALNIALKFPLICGYIRPECWGVLPTGRCGGAEATPCGCRARNDNPDTAAAGGIRLDIPGCAGQARYTRVTCGICSRSLTLRNSAALWPVLIAKWWVGDSANHCSI